MITKLRTRSLVRKERLFKALANRTRRAMLRHLRDFGEGTVPDLARVTGVSRQSVSKHLRILSQVRLVCDERMLRNGHRYRIRRSLCTELRTILSYL